MSVSIYMYTMKNKLSLGWSMDQVHRGGPWTGSMGWSMDWVHKGGPWTRVHVLYTSVMLSNEQKGEVWQVMQID